MAREQIVNNAITTLSGAINGSVTSIPVSDASAFPSVGDFVIIVDREIIQVTSVTGDTFTCVRGYEGSDATPHSDGAIVAHILTAGSLLRHLQNSVPLFGESDAPLANTLVDKAGGILTASSFAAINQGGSTLVDYGNGGVSLYVPPSGSPSLRVWKKAAPVVPASPSALIVSVRGVVSADAGCFGIAYRESDTGKLFVLAFRHTGVRVQKWTDPTTFLGDVGELFGGTGNFIWLKVANDGTNLKAYVSPDGFNWIEIHSEAWAGWMSDEGPDELCLAGNDSESMGIYASYSTWIEE